MEDAAVPALDLSFPSGGTGVPGVHPVPAAEPCPQGEFGDTRRRCTHVPHPLQPGSALPFQSAPHVQVTPGKPPLYPWEMGRGHQALNKEQRLNVLHVCALSLGIPELASLCPSPSGSDHLAFPWADASAELPDGDGCGMEPIFFPLVSLNQAVGMMGAHSPMIS